MKDVYLTDRIEGTMHADAGEQFNLNAAVAAYFEQHARNEKAIADLKAIQKEDKKTLLNEIATGHRNAFSYALGDFNSREYAEMLREEVERRLERDE